MNEVFVSGVGLVPRHGDDALAMFSVAWRDELAVRTSLPDLPKPAAAATVAFDESRWFTELQLAGVEDPSSFRMEPNSQKRCPSSSPVGIWAGCI